MRRRVFLIRAGGILAAASFPAVWLSGCGRAATGEVAVFSDPVLRTLATVQSHLFPSEAHAPGAAELHALGYLVAALNIPDSGLAGRASIIQGAEAVDRLARTQGGKSFAELAEPDREAVLRAFEDTDAGRQWLDGILNLLVEALLADPVYGGNPDGIGWRWLEHAPGFPRPQLEQRWFLLKSL